jgi:hypothetical protein
MNINEMTKKSLTQLVGERASNQSALLVDVCRDYKNQMLLLRQVQKEDEPFSLHWMVCSVFISSFFFIRSSLGFFFSCRVSFGIPFCLFTLFSILIL